MTLMFGNLTLAFVQFGTAVQSAFADGAGPAAMQEFNDASSAFKRAAADDALYLFRIGKFPLLSLPFRAHHLDFATVAISACVSIHGPNEPLLPLPLPLLYPYPYPFPPLCPSSRLGKAVPPWLPSANPPFQALL